MTTIVRHIDRWLTTPWQKRRTVIAIPACNEEDHIASCLLALANQTEAVPHEVIVWVNNTRDRTAERAASLKAHVPFSLTIHMQTYHKAHAHAGQARHDAMKAAALSAGDHGIVLTTDADGEAAPDWLSRTLRAFEQYNADAVFGRALLHEKEAQTIPAQLHEDERAEQAYATLLDRISSWVKPVSHDPWPRHVEHSGASIAVTSAALARVGGMPPLPHSEDRAFHTALYREGLRVRHEPAVKVFVSARLVGRAQGGMADTIARRIAAQDIHVDDTLVPVSYHLRQLRSSQIRRDITQDHKPILRTDLPSHHARAERVLAYLMRASSPQIALSATQAVDPIRRAL